MNNKDRSDWISNDESLYLWWRSSNLNMKTFIKRNKKEIDSYITKKLKG